MVDDTRMQNILYITGGIIAVLAIVVVLFLIYPIKPSPEVGTSRLDAYIDTPSAALVDDTKERFGSGSPIGCPNDYTLCDYYMASSGLSMYAGKTMKDNIYSESISKVIKAGARLVDLNVYDVNKKPVVGYANPKTGVMYSLNTIPFEECCLAIANTAFAEDTTGSRNPFVLSLKIHTPKSKSEKGAGDIMKSCADILKSTLVRFMLPLKYSTTGRNLAVEPICKLMGKLIIVSGPETDGTAMAELVNMVWGRSNLRRVELTKSKQTYTPEEDKEFNRLGITLVVPDEDSTVLTNQGADICMDNYGCQWVAMNYGSFTLSDTDPMTSYINRFSESPFVLKPEPMRKKIVEPPKVVPQDPGLALRPMEMQTSIMPLSIRPQESGRTMGK
jgi:hypothetical protein